MKKIILFFVVMFTSFPISAQYQKGSRVIEGNFNFGTDYSEELSVYSWGNEFIERDYFNLQTHFGWFVTDYSVLGFGLGYENLKIVGSLFDEDNKSSLIKMSTYFTRYFRITDKVSFTTSVELSFGVGEELNFDNVDKNVVEASVMFKPGIKYFILDKLALKVNIGKLYYDITKKEVISEEPYENDMLMSYKYGVDFSLSSFTVGLGYYF